MRSRQRRVPAVDTDPSCSGTGVELSVREDIVEPCGGQPLHRLGSEFLRHDDVGVVGRDFGEGAGRPARAACW